MFMSLAQQASTSLENVQLLQAATASSSSTVLDNNTIPSKWPMMLLGWRSLLT